MPRKADLPYLAHVREVKTDNKETWSLLKEGKFSVVICNRFPETQATASRREGLGHREHGVSRVSRRLGRVPEQSGHAGRRKELSPAGARLLALHLPGKQRFQEPDGTPQ